MKNRFDVKLVQIKLDWVGNLCSYVGGSNFEAIDRENENQRLEYHFLKAQRFMLKLNQNE